MHVRRLACLAALGLAAATIALVPSAHADEVSYGAVSTGQALHLAVFGQELTAGQAVSSVSSDPAAAASGAGIANPLSPVGVTEVAVEGEGSDDAPENCEGSLPAIPGLGLDLACSSSTAAVAGGLPSSAATGTVGDLTVSSSTTLDTLLGDVTGDIQDGVDTLLQQLAPIFGAVDDATDLDTESTVNDLLTALLDDGILANATIGDTSTATTATAGSVTTSCVAEGATVDLIDLPDTVAPVPPVATITVGESSTSVTVDQATGEATSEVDPALVTVSAPTLNIDTAVEVGQTVEIPLPEPLGTSRIVVADGSETTDEDGNTIATASAIRIELLDSEALMGGITLALADCASAAGLTITPDVEPAPATPAPAPEPQPALPKTGGSGLNGWALGGAVLLAGAGLGLARRTRPTS